MKKSVIIISLLLGAVLAFFLVNKFTSKTASTAVEEQTAGEAPKMGHVTEAQWDGNKSSGENSGATAGSAPAPHAGQPVPAEKAEMSKKLVKVSGIEKKFLSMAPMLKEQLEMMISDQQMSAKERDEFLEKFRKNISGEKLLADYQQKLAENFNEQQLGELTNMYEDPQVKKFNQLNNDLSDPEKLRDMQEEITEFMKDADVGGIPPERQKQFARVDKAFNVTDQAVDLTLNMFSLSGEGDAQANKEIKTAIQREIQKGFMFTLRDYPDADLNDFANRVDNPLFQQSNKLVHETIKGPLLAWVKEIQGKNDAGKDKAPKPDAAAH
jgi:hypothetical protein